MSHCQSCADLVKEVGRLTAKLQASELKLKRVTSVLDHVWENFKTVGVLSRQAVDILQPDVASIFASPEARATGEGSA